MNKYKGLFAFLAMVALLAGCGGGGGGGEESSTEGIPAAYTGSRSMAAVTTSNARTIATSAYSGAMVAGSLDVLGKAADGDGILETPLLEVVEMLENTATSATAEPKTSAKSAEAAVSASDSISGYSGYYNIDITMDDSGYTTGAISFVNYRESSYASTINGSITFSGVFDGAASRFTSFKMTFPNVTLTSGSSSRYTITGSVEATTSGVTKILKMTLAVTDNANRTAALKDYTLTLYNNSSLTCTGTFYDPVHGYVTISTLSPLSTSSISAQPTSGSVLVTGSNGSKARLTFYSGYYRITVDATGSGTFVAVP